MAWEDRTPFEAIKRQFGLSEKQVKSLMRTQLKLSSYKMWRVRVTGRVTKHASLRSPEMNTGERHAACLGQPARRP